MIGVVIPTLNEEGAIGEVVSRVPGKVGEEEVTVVVIDGGSTDGTVQEAERAGAEVVQQRYRGGKGAAMRQVFDSYSFDKFVFLDGDGTYNPEEIRKLVNPINKGEAEHVIGIRQQEEGRNAIPALNRFGQSLFNSFVSKIYGREVKDMLSGYRAVDGETTSELPFLADGFGIETEMTLSTLDSDARIAQVPVEYHERKGGESKLNPFSDGFRIIRTILFMARDTKPLMFFSLMAGIFVALSLYPGYFVVKQKLVGGIITHTAPVVMTSLLLIFALQTFLFGLIADQQRNIQKRMEKLLS